MANPAPAGMDDFLNQNAPIAQAQVAQNELRSPASTQAAPEGIDEFIAPEMREAKYGTLPQQVLTAAESAGSAATFGASKGLERILGVKPEDIQGREEENPISSFTGSTAGLVGSSLLLPGGGAAGLLEKAGAGAAEGLGLGAAGVGIGSRLASSAVKGAVEGAMFQSGNEVAKMMLGDPNQTIGTAAVNMGLAGLIGAPIGGGLGALGELWGSTVGKNLGSTLDTASSEMSNIPESKFQTDMLSQGVSDLKPNAWEIQHAFGRLGAEATPGSLSASPIAQNMESVLSDSPTIPGSMVSKTVHKNYEIFSNAAKDTLGDMSNQTEAQVGKKIKEGFQQKLQEELEPIEKSYESLKGDLKKMQLSQDLKDQAIQTIQNNELAKIAPNSKAAKLVDSISEEVGGLQNVDQVKTYRTLINKRLDAAYRAGGEEIPVLQDVKSALNGLREGGIQAAEDSGQFEPGTIDKLKATDQQYMAYKNRLKNMGVESGIGKLNSARDLLQRFGKLSDETFATKIFDTNDINQLNFFKEHFPEQFEAARQFKLKDIYDNSINHAQGKNGRFEVGKFLNQVRDDKLSPEAKELLFQDPAHIQTIKDLQLAHESTPGIVNPSGTAKAIAYGDLLTPKGLINNASDFVKYGILKSIPHLKEAAQRVGGDEAAQLAALQMARNPGAASNPGAFKATADFIRQAVKGENTMSKVTKDIFKSSIQDVLPSRLIPDQKDLDKLDNKAKDLQANNQQMMNVGSDVAHYMPDHGSAMAQTAMNGINYINSVRPSTQKQSPLDGTPVLSQVQKAQFNRVLSIAQQPLVVMNSVKNGNITTQDIMTLKTIYPGLYSRLNQKLTNHLTDAVNRGINIPYKTRLGLATFMGTPLDSTMTPQGISMGQAASQGLTAQKNAQQAAMGATPAQGSRHSSMKDLGKIAMANQTVMQARQASKLKF